VNLVEKIAELEQHIYALERHMASLEEGRVEQLKLSRSIIRGLLIVQNANASCARLLARDIDFLQALLGIHN